MSENTENSIKLPDTSKLIVSSSPHYHSGESVKKMMGMVILALLPAVIAGIIFFGINAAIVMATCIICCLAFESIFSKMMKQPIAIGNLSAALTGLLLGMNLSASTPLPVCLIGSLMAIGLGKMIYGGLGYNPFNPALVGRVGLLIAFPSFLTTWSPSNLTNGVQKVLVKADAITTATPLGFIDIPNIAIENPAQFAEVTSDYWNYFIGNMGGCIGETSAIALLLGGAFLIYKRLIRWEVPLAFLGSVFVISALVHIGSPTTQPTPLFHLLTGGLFLGAFFMATDMVTSPMNRKGAIIMGLGCGIITCVIRIWGKYPEGVSFSILIMNSLVPMIDRYTKKTTFGATKKAKA